VNLGVFACYATGINRDQVDVKRITTKISQAVMERGRDEIWRKARGTKVSLASISIRACFRKILQHDFLHRRSSRSQNINLQSSQHKTIHL
jgi:hypothetical protein